MRAETGVMEFAGDWPGVFIRGDNALMAYAPALRAMLTGHENSIARAQCKQLLDLLESCNAQTATVQQRARLLEQNEPKT